MLQRMYKDFSFVTDLCLTLCEQCCSNIYEENMFTGI